MLTPHGARECIIITTLAAVAAAAALAFVTPWNEVAAIAALCVIGVVWLALLLFFRDPPRRVPPDLQWGDMLSPADGVISAIERVPKHETVAGPAVIIRIFLSVLNVHINRAPFDGEVVAMRYQPGKFLNAQTAESARVNEFNLLTVRIETGETIGLRQVSGMIARRIVCAVKVGDRLRRGGRFGMIKFGSTTELILPHPEEVAVHIRPGQRVRAGRTILATISRT